MKKPILLLLLFNCAIAVGADINTRFEKFKPGFIERLWKVYPDWAVSVGNHQYDGILLVPGKQLSDQRLRFSRVFLDSLSVYKPDFLSANNRTDYYLIRDFLKSVQWYHGKFKDYEWDPSQYNAGGTMAEILAGNYSLLETRLRSLSKRMSQLPAYYQAATKRIMKPTKEHTELAIEQNTGSLSVFIELTDSIKKSKLSVAEKGKMLQQVAGSRKAITDYIDFLQNKIKPAFKDSTGYRSFRIGEKLYAEKFVFDIASTYTAKEVYGKAINHKKYLHAKMAGLTFSLWSKYFPGEPIPGDTLAAIKMMINKISLQHVHRDSFQIAIEKQIPLLSEFVIRKNLLYLDPAKPLVVRVEPAYMQGVAGASISAPGPYDKNANTYYNVGPLTGYSDEEAESYLKEYNRYILQILNIHEAIPGHYTQLVYSNLSPSMIKSIFGNGAMIEGWAVYTERMMLEEGYGDNEPEMWLMYYKWNLRSTCNTILDYSVHVLGMPEQESFRLLTKEAFQQDKEARNKWRRVTLTQVQLCSYFTGFIEIYEFREMYKTMKSTGFSLKAFHEKFLSYGSSPVKYIKALMLEDMGKK